MSDAADHPLVTAYLREFDIAAADVPQAQRLLLREEIAAHLREEVPEGTSTEAATSIIAEFGSPAEVLGLAAHGNPEPGASTDGVPPSTRADESSAPDSAEQESDWQQHIKHRHASRLRAVVFAFALAAVVAIVATAVGAVGGNSSQPASVVVAAPQGPDRIKEGTAYFEYLAAIDEMPDPLPAGATYPDGVVDGLDSGPVLDGGVEVSILASGAGEMVAQFTWLCAWESEYLSAVEIDDAKRQVAAEAMLEKWLDDPGYMGHAIEGAPEYYAPIFEAMSFGKPAAVKADRAQSCAQASIFGVDS